MLSAGLNFLRMNIPYSPSTFCELALALCLCVVCCQSVMIQLVSCVFFFSSYVACNFMLYSVCFMVQVVYSVFFVVVVSADVTS